MPRRGRGASGPEQAGPETRCATLAPLGAGSREERANVNIDSRPPSFQLRTIGDVTDLRQTAASETPTAPDAPIPGVALDPSMVVPDEARAQPPVEDPLTALQRRDHPFA